MVKIKLSHYFLYVYLWGWKITLPTYYIKSLNTYDSRFSWNNLVWHSYSVLVEKLLNWNVQIQNFWTMNQNENQDCHSRQMVILILCKMHTIIFKYWQFSTLSCTTNVCKCILYWDTNLICCEWLNDLLNYWPFIFAAMELIEVIVCWHSQLMVNGYL